MALVTAQTAAIAPDANPEGRSADPSGGAAQSQLDLEIIEGLRSGDDRAFERLVREYVGPLHAVALRLLQNDADADDAVQEAFLNAFRYFDGFRADARLGTWLHRIVVNAALGRLRKRKRRPDFGADVIDINELLPQFGENGHPKRYSEPWVQPAEELATRAETREQVRRMIDKLPDNYRTVLILRDIEELSTAETSELLELSLGTVKVRLHRARQALRNLLEAELELTQRA